MNSIQFQLNLSKEEYIRYYQGSARFVLVRAHDGRTVKFPASLLRQFVTRDGVRGQFELRFDERNKLRSLRKL